MAKKRDPQKTVRSSPRQAIMAKQFREDLAHWTAVDRKIALRLLELMEAALRDPFSGVGKPEPLKHLGPDLWSRRLSAEHRMVYKVFPDRIDFLMARYHY